MDIIYLDYHRNLKKAETSNPVLSSDTPSIRRTGPEQRIALALFRLKDRCEELESYIQMLEERLDDLEELVLQCTSPEDAEDTED